MDHESDRDGDADPHHDTNSNSDGYADRAAGGDGRSTVDPGPEPLRLATVQVPAEVWRDWSFRADGRYGHGHRDHERDDQDDLQADR